MTLPVFVINRVVDIERLEQFSASAAQHGIAFNVVEAIDAHAPDFSLAHHAALIGDHFWGEDQIKPGAVGCFLSHRKAWETVLSQGLAQALICEDDAVFLENLERLEEVASALPKADVIFANQRLAAWASATGAEGSPPLSGVLERLAALGGPKVVGIKPTPGADAYLVTAAGAARLLEITTAQRIVCGVDWAMVRAASGAIAPLSKAFPELGILAGLDPPQALSAVVLTQPVAGQSGRHPSSIRHRLTVPIGEI